MIVYETADAFVLTEQHDHAGISGEVVAHWKNEHLYNPDTKDELQLAATEHDRGWINLDAAPFWNDASTAPYSFKDFPLRPRYVFYRLGIQEVEQRSPYAALLCSLMYTELFERIQIPDPQDEAANRAFLDGEVHRRTRLYELLGDTPSLRQRAAADLHMLLFCDELSLFVCLAEPGTPSSKYEWFADGLHHPSPGPDTGRLRVRWTSGDSIEMDTDALLPNASITHTYRTIYKKSIREHGLYAAFHSTPSQQRTITLHGKVQTPVSL
ncbi:hypothetical protein D3C74_01440 [compost metagenome]